MLRPSHFCQGLSLVLFPLLAFSPPAEDCSRLITKAYDKLDKIFRQGDTVSIKVDMVTVYRKNDSSQPGRSTEQIQLIADKSRCFYTNGSVEVYQDNKHSIVILKPEKTVLISSPAGVNRNVFIDQLQQGREALLKHAKVSSCLTAQANQTTLRKIVLVPGPDQQRTLAIGSMEYWLKPNDEMRRMIFHYRKEHKLVEVSMDFKEMRTGVNTSVLSRVDISTVLDANNQLLPRYKGYRLIDQRER